MKLFDQYRGRTSQYLRKRLFTGEKVMRNNVVTIATTATLIASQLAVPAMPQAPPLPYPNPGGPQLQPPRTGGPQIPPPRPGGPPILLPVPPRAGYAAR